jgi:hypothetical protein
VGIFGGSYPPGAAGDPYAPYNQEGSAIELTPRFVNRPIPGVSEAWWDEDGNIITEPAGEPLNVEWDDNLSEAQNEVRAVNALRRSRSVDRRMLSRARGKLILAQAILERAPVPTFDSVFEGLKGYIPQIETGEDFRVGEDAAADAEWHPYFCEDCDTWHKATRYPVFKREDGELAIEFRSCDGDGDDECVGEARRGDSPRDWAQDYKAYLSCYTHGLAWAEYHLWCAENDPMGDPCEDYAYSDKPITAARHLKDAVEYIGNIRRMKRALSR